MSKSCVLPITPPSLHSDAGFSMSGSLCAPLSAERARACRSGEGGNRVINASKRQLWSGLTRFEISLRDEGQSGSERRGRRRRFLLPDKQKKAGAFSGGQ